MREQNTITFIGLFLKPLSPKILRFIISFLYFYTIIMHNSLLTHNSVVIGIDIGGTKISAALFDIDGKILLKEAQSIAKKRGAQVGQLVAELLLGIIDHTKKAPYDLMAIGVCVPGIYSPLKKTVWAPNIPDWIEYPLWNELTNLIKMPCVKIIIESDRSCYILGEVWKGKAQGCTDAIFMAVGTGIGAGILSSGNIISGRNGIAGAIGWMALKPPYKTKYDNWGNFEHYASGDGIARSAVELLDKSKETKSLLHNISIDKITSQDVFQAYEKGDSIAVAVIDQAIVYWGMAIANLISIFNPEKVILGGGVFGPANQLLDRIWEEAKQWAQPISIKEVILETSALHSDSGLIGAGYLAIKTIKDLNHVK